MRSLQRLAIHSVAVAILVTTPFTSASADPSHLWSKRFGSTSEDRINAVTVDAFGNVFITGRFEGSVSFGGPPISSIAGPGYSMFVAKFNPSGVHLWSKAFVGEGLGIAVDASGNIFVTGAFEGTTNFGGGPLTSAKNTAGPTARDVFLVKFDTNGAHQWSKRFGGPSVVDTGNGIAVDATGAVVMTGTIATAVDFGGGAISGGGQFDIFVAKYDSNGVHQWSKAFGGTRFDIGEKVAVDGLNNVLITGTFLGTVDFGGGPIVNSFGDAVFLAKYDANGNYVWSRAATGYVSSTRADATGIVVDNLGSPIIVGYFSGYYNFGGTDVGSGGGSDDVFVARYDQDGAHIWSHGFGFGGGNARAASIAVAPTGFFVTGTFNGSIDFGGGILSGLGLQDIFVAKFDLAGYHTWSKRVGGSQDDVSRTIALSPLGNIVVGGNFSGTADFGGGGLVSAGSEDAFVASYLDEAPVPVLIHSFDAVARDHQIELRWSLTSDEDLKAVSFYRSQADGEFALIGHVAPGEHSYLDAAVRPGTSYRYQLAIETADGDIFRSQIVAASTRPLAAGLGQNSPNPFNPRTSIEYTLNQSMSVAINIYDAAGALVIRLEQGNRDPGVHRVDWDGKDSRGRFVASGVYFYRLAGLEAAGTRKMVLLK